MKFEVLVRRIDSVENHPDADRLSLNKIGGYIAISNKVEGEHRYQAGDLVVYIPEGAIVPETILRPGYWDETKNKGILAGPNGDRVKAIKLRGILSQGLVLQTIIREDGTYISLYTGAEDGYYEYYRVNEGDDVAEILGIKKYEPVIPASMSGEVFASFDHKYNYDLEDIKKYPDVLFDWETVQLTEKLHGTFCSIQALPEGQEHEDALEGRYLVSSKGLLKEGLFLKGNDANKAGNLYIRTLINSEAWEGIKKLLNEAPPGSILFGEIFGEGVQDLRYSQKPGFRAFDLWIGGPNPMWLPAALVDFSHINIECVPTLAIGQWGEIKKNLALYRDGKSSIDGTTLKEGVVIKPAMINREDKYIGRVAFKAVSPDYLLRKGETTEFA